MNFIELILNDESNWWQVENNNNNNFIWTSGYSKLKINISEIKKVEILIEYNGLVSNNLKIKTNNDLCDIGMVLGNNLISIFDNNKNISDVAIISDTFIPNKLNSDSTDFRTLGIMLKSIKLFLNDSTDCINVNIQDLFYSNENSNYINYTNELNKNGSLFKSKKYKSFYVSSKKTKAIFLYLDKPYKTIFKSLKDYKISKNYKLILFSGDSEVCESIDDVIKIENFNINCYNNSYKKMFEGAKAFKVGLDIASDKNIDYLFWLEWDCLIGADYWFDSLWEEHNSWIEEPVISGTPIATPCIHNYIKEGYNLHYLMQNYTSEYINDNKIAMGSIPHNRESLFFINGALSFYNVNEVKEYFVNCNPEISRSYFDVYIGKMLYKKYKEKIFEKCAWLKSSYSGGYPYKIYTDEQILNMLNTGLKKIVHPYKVF